MTKKKIYILVGIIAAVVICSGLIFGYIKKISKSPARQKPVNEQVVTKEQQEAALGSLLTGLPDGKAIITDLQKKYSAAKTFKTSWKAEYTIDAGKSNVQKKKLDDNSILFKRPNKFFINSDNNKTYIDGKNLVMYSNIANFYRKETFKPEMLKAMALPENGVKVIGLLTGVDYTKTIEKFEPVKTETVDAKEMYVVAFALKSPESVKSTQTLWIDKASMTIYRNDMVIVQTIDSKSYTTKTSSVSSLTKFDEPVSDGLFVFKAPKGAKSIADVKMPPPQAGVEPVVPQIQPQMPQKQANPQMVKPVNMEGKPIYDFSYKLANVDKKLSGNGKVTVLNFWAMPNCESQLPIMQALKDKYGDAVELVFVNLNDDSKKIEALLADKKLNFPVVFADKHIADIAARHYHLIGVPTMYIIDASGIIKKQYMGFSDSSVLITAIDALLPNPEAAPTAEAQTQETQPPTQ